MNNKEFISKFTSFLSSFLNTCVVLSYLVLTTGTVVERFLRIRSRLRILTYTPYLAEIQRLQGALAAHTGSYQQGAEFGMPVALQAAPMLSARPREFYCWLHG